MKTTFDTDAILFGILKNSPVKQAINGGFYVGDDRPDDSTAEDIVVNSIDLTQEYLPQVGTSNVNIYVPDMPVMIAGKQQFQANRVRLKAITTLVFATLRAAKVQGILFRPSSSTLLNEPKIRQHFVNIRIDWNIQID